MDLKEAGCSTGGFRHPWEVARAEFFKRLARRQGQGSLARTVLDMGSGDAWLARELLTALPAGSSVHCVDASYDQDMLKQGLVVGLSKSQEVPKGQKFDWIFLLDVVEHVREDRLFLQNLVKNHLRTDGLVVISVPAYQSLYSAHDTWLEHFRRYSPAAGRTLVADCGLEVLEEGGLFHCLLYVRLLEKWREAWQKQVMPQGGVGRWQGGEVLSFALTWGLNLDWRLTEALRSVGLRIPGLSWWCVCRKAL